MVNGKDVKAAIHAELIGGYSGDQLFVRLMLFYCLLDGSGAMGG